MKIKERAENIACFYRFDRKADSERNMGENRRLTGNIWKDGKPKKWYYALPVIAVWLLIIGLIVRAILGLYSK